MHATDQPDPLRRVSTFPDCRAFRAHVLPGVLAVALLAGGVQAQATGLSRGGHIRDIRYGPRPLEVLDLSMPAVQGFPSVIYVHEGSLTSGDKGDAPYDQICENFVAHNVACAVANYTLLRDGGRWPQPAEDVAAVFAWVHGNIAARGGDARRVFLLGHSSGCHLAALVGTDARYLATLDLAPSDIAGVIALGCRLDNRVDSATVGSGLVQFYSSLFGSVTATNDAAPFMHIGAGMAPLLIMMGDAETENPPILSDAKRFAEKSRGVGREVPIEVLADRKHMTAMQGLARADDPAFRRVMQFISSVGRQGQ